MSDPQQLLRQLKDEGVTIDVALATVKLWLEELPYDEAAAHVMYFVTGGGVGPAPELPPELAAQLGASAPPPPPAPAAA
jgi:hypothetical protein